MLRKIYTLLLYVFLPLALLKLLWRSRENIAYRQGWKERFGEVGAISAAKYIWIHAVSVGETIAIRPLVEALLLRYPQYNILFTNGTINGHIRATVMYKQRVILKYAPYDFPWAIDHFLDQVSPVLVLIMETEVWPNWMMALQKKNIPAVLVNARLSERSYRRYDRFRSLFSPVFNRFTRIAAQAESDATRYVALGVTPSHIEVVGNLKYNFSLPEDLASSLAAWRRMISMPLIWVTASTHPGEEEQLLSVFSALKEKYPALLWVLAPRHPERAIAVKKCCEAGGWSVTLRSTLEKVPASALQTDILLVDTLGELAIFYGLSEVTFVGGSLIPHGGHNILEPAALGTTAITCGPSMFNFSAIAEQFIEQHALVQCQNNTALAEKTIELFGDAALRKKYAEAALHCFKEKQQALQNHMTLIEQVLGGVPNGAVD